MKVAIPVVFTVVNVGLSEKVTVLIPCSAAADAVTLDPTKLI